MLNGGWYASLYRQTYLNETARLVHRLERRIGPADRITVLEDGSDALASVSRYLKFWLDIPVTGYWVGSGAAPWYADLRGEPAPTPELSGVIATYNRAAQLRTCLDALARQDAVAGAFEVIVVVDGSTDGTAEMLATYHAPYQLSAIHQTNAGQCRALNRGVSE